MRQNHILSPVVLEHSRQAAESAVLDLESAVLDLESAVLDLESAVLDLTNETCAQLGCAENKNRRYISEWLLKVWRLQVDPGPLSMW